jgi:hypothetical protein
MICCSEVKITALKKPKATKYSNHDTISLIKHTAELVVRILRRGIENKIENIMPSMVSEQTLGTDEELSACFMDWQKASDCVNWTKFMHILKEAGID